MGHLCLTIGWVEEDSAQAPPREISRIDLPTLESAPLPIEEGLDVLGQRTLTIGHQVMRQLLSAQWEIADQQQVENYRAQVGPETVKLHGYDEQPVASRLGILHLRRQVCFNESTRVHRMPRNRLLPEHRGVIITRGLQEWACLPP